MLLKNLGQKNWVKNDKIKISKEQKNIFFI